ncbi:MAG: alpha/beta fold hydrolase, partial [Oscillospiraceae bacterium]|nr:alpha/beta fold hydrolase [Oscillospiraceae bacterium]
MLFGTDIGDREIWLQKAAQQIGAERQYEVSKYNAMHGAYEWNDKLMKLDGVYDGAHLFRLRIFCIFFIFAILIAFALRMIIDTAFEVSSKERERHYGVLQSIGATPEQIVRIITYEGLRLCVIAVPFGLIAGIGFAWLMYHVLIAAGISELYQGMTNAKLSLPFSVDPKMLLVAAAVGIVWVFLSAYGVGMRIIKKMPMEAITARADNVKKVKNHTLSGLLFGISGSIASRNTRRQKKRFVITVLTLTVSITMFALFSSLANTVERSFLTYETDFVYEQSKGADFSANISSIQSGSTYMETAAKIADSGLFKDISIMTFQRLKDYGEVAYMSRETYAQQFGNDPAVSYDELVRTGGYVLNTESGYAEALSGMIEQDTVQLETIRYTLPADLDCSGMDRQEIRKNLDLTPMPHSFLVLGQDNITKIYGFVSLIGAIETYEQIADEWFGISVYGVDAAFSFNGNGDYNAADYKKASDWFMEHSDTVSLENDFYRLKWRTQNIMASVRAGVLMLNLLLALAALINLLNIISTGIANRRSELASLQCVGMTDRQLDRMAMIECLQFAGAAAIISAVICALVIFGSEGILSALIRDSFVDESEETKKMLMNIVRIDHITPFVRIVLSALAAFAAGCITSLVMLRTQNKESLSDQVRGAEMKLDTKKSHILRNSILAVTGAFVLVIAGLRIYSVAAYRRDRNEYAKAGYLNLVESNGFKMNVYSTGAEHGKHTIVGLAGFPSFAFPVETTKLNELLAKENTLVYPDRAGYGFSDDSLKKQTLRQVVEDYRTGLKNAGFEAPYVLMGHSYGGYYAMMWEAMYPDEVESIIFLSGTPIPRNECWSEMAVLSEYPSIKEARKDSRRMILRTWLGLDRLFPPEETGGVFQGAAFFSEEQKALTECCNNRL